MKDRRREYQEEYRSNPINKERLKVTHHLHYLKNKEKLKERSRLYRLKHHEKVKACQRRSNARIKFEVLTHYSVGPKPTCSRCGIDDVDVLTIDHINGGGTARRRNKIEHSNTCAWLRQYNYPSGYQVLCANCNLKKRIIEKC